MRASPSTMGPRFSLRSSKNNGGHLAEQAQVNGQGADKEGKPENPLHRTSPSWNSKPS
jgi:hypothetical protein